MPSDSEKNQLLADLQGLARKGNDTAGHYAEWLSARMNPMVNQTLGVQESLSGKVQGAAMYSNASVGTDEVAGHGQVISGNVSVASMGSASNQKGNKTTITGARATNKSDGSFVQGVTAAMEQAKQVISQVTS